MPPSPTITATIDDDKYQAACEALSLKDPPTVQIKSRRINVGDHRNCYGVYWPGANHIEVSITLAEYDFDSLRAVMTELALTLLHELRHAWQHEHHGDDRYAKNVLRAEAEAEGWAHRQASNFRGIIRVQRKFHGSGLSKLSATAARIRRDV